MVVIKGMVEISIYDQNKYFCNKGLISRFFLGEDEPILVNVLARILHGVTTHHSESACVVTTVKQNYSHISLMNFFSATSTKRYIFIGLKGKDKLYI